jgi:hypothetical protein
MQKSTDLPSVCKCNTVNIHQVLMAYWKPKEEEEVTDKLYQCCIEYIHLAMGEIRVHNFSGKM